MFENSSIMVLRANTKEDEVYKIEVDAQTKNTIIASMENALNDLIAEKTQIIFDGSYKPNEDEILKIENYQLSDEIKDAIRDPLGVPSFKKDNDVFPESRQYLLVRERKMEKQKCLMWFFRDLEKNNTFQQNGVIFFLKTILFFKRKDSELV